MRRSAVGRSSRARSAGNAVLAMDGKAPEHLGVLELGEHVLVVHGVEVPLSLRAAPAPGDHRSRRTRFSWHVAIDTKHMFALYSGQNVGCLIPPEPHPPGSPEGWPHAQAVRATTKRSSTSSRSSWTRTTTPRPSGIFSHELGISSTSVVDYNLKVLEDRNHIRRNRNTLPRHRSGGGPIPVRRRSRSRVIGSIAAGQPIPVPGDLEAPSWPRWSALAPASRPDGGRGLFGLASAGIRWSTR